MNENQNFNENTNEEWDTETQKDWEEKMSEPLTFRKMSEDEYRQKFTKKTA